METCCSSLTVVNSKKVWNLSNVWKNLVCLAFFERIYRISTSGSFFVLISEHDVLCADCPCPLQSGDSSQQLGVSGGPFIFLLSPHTLFPWTLQDSAHLNIILRCCGVLSQKSPLGSKSCCVKLSAVKADVGFVKYSMKSFLPFRV